MVHRLEEIERCPARRSEQTGEIAIQLNKDMLTFVRAARSSPGVPRIALLGSLATDKPVPKAADVLLTIAPPWTSLVATAHFFEKNQLVALPEKRDKV
jgi:hypothetical protein